MIRSRLALAALLAALSAACVPGEGGLQYNTKGEIAIAAAAPLADADVLATMKGCDSHSRGTHRFEGTG